MRRTYELINSNPAVIQINIELELQCPLDITTETLHFERQARPRSVQYWREELGINSQLK